MRSVPVLPTSFSAACVAASNFVMSNGLQGSNPIVFIFASIAPSSAAGGAVLHIRFAIMLKYAAVSMALMTACGLSVMLNPGFGLTAGACGVNGLPHADSGVILYFACNAFTAL